LADGNRPISVAAAIAKVLETPDPTAKIFAARAVARDWRLGRLAFRFDRPMPDRPSRPARPELRGPADMPRRGKGGSARGRIAMLHALAHIEFVAIDLAFDLMGRFGSIFPKDFLDDWMRVGAEEAMHFALLDRRLRSLGSHYGAMPAHDGLWEAAESTAHDALARLAIVPMVLEARGLDVTPMTIERFQDAGDGASARILERIMEDEIRHVAFGVRWFESRCQSLNCAPHQLWKDLVSRHFRGSLKPPFNDSARQQAGLTRDFYQSLAS
jgi:uncharacterized ferritin-like protein (DUF455 family)